MAAGVRVLDLAGRALARPVDVIATPVTELVIGIGAFGFAEAAHTLAAGPDWFGRIRSLAGPEVLAALARLGPAGWGSLLGAALAEGWPLVAENFVELATAMPEEELWLLFAGAHVRPFAERFTPEVFARAARGDQDARERLAEADRTVFGGTQARSRVWDLAAAEVRGLVCTVLRGWHRDVFPAQAREATAVLERDARAKQRMRGAMPDQELIESATNGLVLTPDPWVRRIVLTPHIAMRPWNVICAHGETYVICYPVADGSLGGDPGAPPASLLRLHKALADEKRLRILRLLARSDMNLAELSEAVGLAKSTTHHHMVLLRSAGLTRSSSGPENRYSLRREAVGEAGAALREFLEAPGR